MICHIGIGTNLGDRMSNLVRAAGELRREGFNILKCSNIYETSPVGPGNQGPYLNTVWRVECDHDPRQALECFKKIEKRMGRTDGPRFSPRVMDIDMVLCGDLVLDRDEPPQVPHPRFARRWFVLAPLKDLDPDLADPRTGRTVSELFETGELEGKGKLHTTGSSFAKGIGLG